MFLIQSEKFWSQEAEMRLHLNTSFIIKVHMWKQHF